MDYKLFMNVCLWKWGFVLLFMWNVKRCIWNIENLVCLLRLGNDSEIYCFFLLFKMKMVVVWKL